MPERSNNNKSSRRTKQAPIDTTFGHLQPQAIDIEKPSRGSSYGCKSHQQKEATLS